MRPITEADISAGLDDILAGKIPEIRVCNSATKPATRAATQAPVAPPDRDWLFVGSTGSRKGPSLALILRAVSDMTGIGLQDLKSPRRNQRIVRARMIYFALARRLTERSLPQIGRAAGHRDHTTVLHGLRMVANEPDRFEPELSGLTRAFAFEEPEE